MLQSAYLVGQPPSCIEVHVQAVHDDDLNRQNDQCDENQF